MAILFCTQGFSHGFIASPGEGWTAAKNEGQSIQKEPFTGFRPMAIRPRYLACQIPHNHNLPFCGLQMVFTFFLLS